jgi:hypothetical protein
VSDTYSREELVARHVSAIETLIHNPVLAVLSWNHDLGYYFITPEQTAPDVLKVLQGLGIKQFGKARPLEEP